MCGGLAKAVTRCTLALAAATSAAVSPRSDVASGALEAKRLVNRERAHRRLASSGDAAKSQHMWYRCTGSASAYAAAWFAGARTVADTRWGNTLGMEFHDFNLFNQGGNTRPRMGLKAQVSKRFWVDHLSMYEHKLRREGRSGGKVDEMVQDVAKAHMTKKCGPLVVLNETDPTSPLLASIGSRSVVSRPSIIGLVPYYGGSIENTKGNAHSKVSRTTKLLQLHATACAIQSELGGRLPAIVNAAEGATGNEKEGTGVFNAGNVRIVVGVCNSRDRADVLTELGGESSPLLWRVVQYVCEEDPYLAPTLLRDFQAKFKGGNQWEVDFVFFTEQDQVGFKE